MRRVPGFGCRVPGAAKLLGLGVLFSLAPGTRHLTPVLQAQQRPGANSRSCVIHVDSVRGGTQFLTMSDGTQNVFAGGGVWARCVNEPTTITSDSFQYFQSAGQAQFIGRVHFQDSASVLDADRITYYIRQERLFAQGNVFTRNLAGGSEMRGPNLDYYRAVPPIRDTIELLATGRPTIRFVPANDSVRGDTAHPFIIIADRTRMRHTDRMWGSGRVVIDRPGLHATADSASLSLADSVGWLIGVPIIVGRDTTRAADSARAAGDTSLITYRLTGQRVRFDMGGGQQIRRVISYHDADALGPDWRLTADTLDMALDSGKIQRAQAWGDERRPVALSGLSRIVADSLDIQMPGQQMRMVWAFGHAQATSKPDSAAQEEDWLSGDTLRADFAEVRDSTGRAASEIEHVTAFGGARAYYHVANDQDSAGPPGINYSRGDRIRIAMRERRVRTVDIVGAVDGLYLEPLPPGWETLQVDTTRRDTAFAPGATPANRPQVTPPPPGAPQRPAPEAARERVAVTPARQGRDE